MKHISQPCSLLISASVAFALYLIQLSYPATLVGADNYQKTTASQLPRDEKPAINDANRETLKLGNPVNNAIRNADIDEGKKLYDKFDCVQCHQIKNSGGYLV